MQVGNYRVLCIIFSVPFGSSEVTSSGRVGVGRRVSN